MIIDCYTHIWESQGQLGRCVPSGDSTRPFARLLPDESGPLAAKQLACSEPVDLTILVGFKSNYLGAEIPNAQIAEYASTHSDRTIAFAGVDPSDPKQAVADMRHAAAELGMRGIAVAPAAQDFHPSNSQAMLVYAEAVELKLPILFHTGIYLARETKLEYARPVLLDEVARELPDAKIIVAHMGYPWTEETVALLAKHPNVFAEISWIVSRPWQAYQALAAADQYGVMEKLLFGSGFPFASAADVIESIYSINHICGGTHLPTIPRENLRGIVERDTLSLLGIGSPIPTNRTEPTPVAASLNEA